MEIVPTSTPKKRESGFEELLIRKAALKQQIEAQKVQVTVSYQNFLKPVSFPSLVLQTFGKGFSIVDGILVGYKIVRLIRKIFVKK
ncbi:MAG: hypothetical protein WCG93_12715 [Paludibacter sp.]